MKVKSRPKPIKPLMWALVACLVGGPLQAADLLVPSQFPDIQTAYAAALPGDDIVIDQPGLYVASQGNALPADHLKQVDIRGAVDGVVLGVDQNLVDVSTTVQGPVAIEFSNLTFRFIGTTFASSYIRGVPFVSFYLCTIENMTMPTAVQGFCEASYMVLDRVRASQCSGGFLFRTAEVYAVHCVFSGATNPIWTTGLGESNVISCRFEDSSIGIYQRHAVLHVDGSSFIGCRTPVYAYKSNSYTATFIHRCHFIDSDSSQSFGTSNLKFFDPDALVISSCVFSGNKTSRSVVEVSSLGSTLTWLTNNTFKDNIVSTGSSPMIVLDGSHCEVHDNVMWNPQYQSSPRVELNVTTQTMSVLNNIVSGWGGTNQLINPQFIQGDVHLLSQSPALDASSGWYTPQQDAYLENRGPSPDKGAVEKKRSLVVTVLAQSLTFDVYGDPGESVYVVVGKYARTGFPTPYGPLNLDPAAPIVTVAQGTIGANGRLTLSAPVTGGTSKLALGVQALVGSTLVQAKQIVEP